MSLEYFNLHTISVNSSRQCGGRCSDTSKGGEHLIRIFVRQHFEHFLKMAGIPHGAPDNVSDNEDHEDIVDKLLCFLSNKIDVLHPQTIADLCATSFDDIEIENSKKHLSDLCVDEKSSRFRRRQGPKKSAVNIDDMLRLLHEKGSDVPVFVARDLSS